LIHETILQASQAVAEMRSNRLSFFCSHTKFPKHLKQYCQGTTSTSLHRAERKIHFGLKARTTPES
jgi:hypothetical protein